LVKDEQIFGSRLQVLSIFKINFNYSLIVAEVVVVAVVVVVVVQVVVCSVIIHEVYDSDIMVSVGMTKGRTTDAILLSSLTGINTISSI
jgi:hypothetical protein